MIGIICITSADSVSADYSLYSINCALRRVLTAQLSRALSEIRVILSCEHAALEKRLQADPRISSKVSFYRHSESISDPEEVLPLTNTSAQAILLIRADIFSANLPDRVVSALTEQGCSRMDVLDRSGRIALTAFPAEAAANPPVPFSTETTLSLHTENGEFALVLTTPESLNEGKKILSHHAGRPGDGLVSRYLNRPISRRLTPLFVRLHLRPSDMTFLTIVIGLIGAWLNTRSEYASICAGALAFHLSSVLDGCDGEMARLTFRESRFGEWFDNIGDVLVSSAYVASFGIFALLHHEDTLLFGISMWGLLATWAGAAIMYRNLLHLNSGSLTTLRRLGESRISGIGNLVKPLILLFRREYFSVLLVALALAQWREITIIGSAVVNTAFLAIAVISSVLMIAKQPS